MRATISILTATAVREARWCINNLIENTHPDDYQLLLTANGPAAVDLFDEVKNQNPDVQVTIHRNLKNEGFIEPNRKALRLVPHSDSEIFVMLNDDAFVPPNWLDDVFVAFLDKNLAACGPVGRRLDENFRGGFKCLGNPEYIEGCCLAVRSSMAKSVGFFDPNLKLAYGEDSDLCLSLRKAGYGIRELDFPFAHIGSATTKKLQSKELLLAFNENHAYLRKKWAGYLHSSDRQFALEYYKGHGI